MKVTQTSEGVILTVSDLRELFRLNGVKYFVDEATKLSNNIVRIESEGPLVLNSEEIAQMALISADSSFIPEIYDLTLYGKEIGNLGLYAYDVQVFGNVKTLIKVNLNYPEATKFYDAASEYENYGKNQINLFAAPFLESIPYFVFAYSKIKEFSGDSLRSIGKSAFYRSEVEHVYASNVTYIGELAFGDSQLQEVDFPKVEKIICSTEEDIPFLNCNSLSSFKMDGLKYCINVEADSWFFRMQANDRYSWLREHGYIYTPTALATKYMEIDYLTGLDIFTSNSSSPIEVSLKSYNCGKGIPELSEEEKAIVFNGIPSDEISFDYLYFKIGNSFWSKLQETESLNIQSMDTIPSNFVKNAPMLKNVVFSKDLKCVYDSGFEGCEQLSGIVSFPKLDYVGLRAFADCGKISKIVLPKYMETIDSEAFSGCSSLTALDGAECVSFYGRKSSDVIRTATDILYGTQAQNINYNESSWNPFQFKNGPLDESVHDLFGKEVVVHSPRYSEYLPLSNEVPGIVIHPFIRTVTPFVVNVLSASEINGYKSKIAIPADQYLDYILKCENCVDPPGYDPSFLEISSTIEYCSVIRQKIEEGLPVSDEERQILAHEDELKNYSETIQFVLGQPGSGNSRLSAFVPSEVDVPSVFDLSSDITETDIYYGKNNISKFETTKKDFFSFTPSYIESWELYPATPPELSVIRVFDSDFINKTNNIEFKVDDLGRKSSKISLSVVVKEYDTGKVVWRSSIYTATNNGQVISSMTNNQESGKMYTAKVIGVNSMGLSSDASINYKATAYSAGSLSYVDVSSKNSTTILVKFKLGKLPKDKDGNEFNPDIDIIVKDETGNTVIKSEKVYSATTEQEYSVYLSDVENDSTYTIATIVNGSADVYDYTNITQFVHRVVKTIRFTTSGHYSGKEWRFTQTDAVEIEWPVGKPYAFLSDIAAYNMTTSYGTTLYGWTKTVDSFAADYNQSGGITLLDSDPNVLVLYPVPGIIAFGYGYTYSATVALETKTNKDRTITQSGNSVGSLAGINTGLAQSRTWYARVAKIDVSNIKSCHYAFLEFRDTNRSSGTNDFVTFYSTETQSVSTTNIGVQANSSGYINTWAAGYLEASRRDPVTASITGTFSLVNGFWTIING